MDLLFRSVFKEQISLGLQKLFLQKLFFRYSKVFILQWKLKYKKEEEAYQGGSIIDEATEEMRRAISLKAVEAFMEAAPQFFLQIYITYKRKQENPSWCKLNPWSQCHKQILC